MLSYQHIYHAGNFADVHKHALLALLLKTLTAKPQKICLIDTHAGRGVYDLNSDEAQKNAEFDNGIMPMWQKNALPADYANVIRAVNDTDAARRYPGSAKIARHMLRPRDTLVCIERHPGEFKKLQDAMKDAPNTELLHDDGFRALLDFAPQAGCKGIAVIDPSYEIKTEYADTARLLHAAWKKRPQDVFMLWYPILPAGQHAHMLRALQTAGVSNALISELRFEAMPHEAFHMYGTGVLFINPPWPAHVPDALASEIAQALPQAAASRCSWLDNMHGEE